MKLLLAGLMNLLWLFPASSQQAPRTQEELDAFIKEMKRKSDSIQQAAKNRNPGNSGTNPGPNNRTGPSNTNVQEPQKLPEADSARIRSLPKKTLTATELNYYLSNLHEQIASKLPAPVVASAKSIAQKLGNHSGKLEAAALLAWQNGADEEALLLITKAAAINNNDGLVLVNTGAILDMYGLSEKAIPILRAVVHHDPKSVIALNNLGQAYTAIGMRDSGMHYFSRCLSLSSQHPQANATAGLIELKKGNKAQAQTYFENSLRGSFNLAAYTGLATIYKDNKAKFRIAQLIKPKVKHPEYFNQFKYKLPRQCLNVFEAATVREEFDAYKKMMNTEIQKVSVIKKEIAKSMGPNWAAEFNQRTMEKILKGESYMRPFQALGSAMEAETVLSYADDLANIQKFNTENREQYKQLHSEYNRALDQLYKSGARNCAAENELKNKYLEKFAALNEEWQTRNMLVENKHIDDFLFWSYFSAFDVKDYRSRFYNQVYNYLYQTNFLAQVVTFEPCEEKEPEEIEPPLPKELKEFDCPAKIQFGFGVGKFSMDCDKVSFKAGELIVFKFEKQFKGKRETTLSIGGGGGVDLMEGAGPIKAGFEAGMDMSMYFTFDMAGNCTDAGMVYSAYRGIGVDFSAGERINLSRKLFYAGDEFGWRFGTNSGVSFTPPNIPWLKEVRETPVNKHIRIFNPQ